MKTLALQLILTLFLGALSSLFAEGSIDAQLRAIQNAPSAQRVKLMNQFKQRLAKMNAQDRAAAINTMRAQMSTSTKHANNEMHDRARQEQMQQSEHMQRMDKMQERHGWEQMDRHNMDGRNMEDNYMNNMNNR